MIKYIQKPNLPNKCSSGVILDCRADKETTEELKRLGLKIITSLKLGCLYDAVASHPDMQIHHLGDNRFVCANEAYTHYRNQLFDAEIISGEKNLKTQYPEDVLYNCVRLDKYLINNAACTAIEILREYEPLKRINVKQGYTKCNIAIVSKNAIITSDSGVYKALNKEIDVLKIQAGFIELSGLDYGFIGGSTGLISNDTLAVNGELKTHPDKDNIISFCKEHKVYIHELKKGVIKDIGSIIPIF